MSSLAINSTFAIKVECTDDEIIVHLADGRRISAPIIWFPRLANANATERNVYELIGNGEGIHWPNLDEDISVSGLLAGKPSVEFNGHSQPHKAYK
jgi:hypothetical protein